MGPGKVEVKSIDFPRFISPKGKQIDHGAIIKPFATNICGSDQHMVRGRTTAPAGLILGHEITGEVIEAGPGVEYIKVGDLVSMTGQAPVMKYHRELMQAILNDRAHIANAVNATVISLDEAPEGYRDFDSGVAKKFVLDPHRLLAS